MSDLPLGILINFECLLFVVERKHGADKTLHAIAAQTQVKRTNKYRKRDAHAPHGAGEKIDEKSWADNPVINESNECDARNPANIFHNGFPEASPFPANTAFKSRITSGTTVYMSTMTQKNPRKNIEITPSVLGTPCRSRRFTTDSKLDEMMIARKRPKR